MPGPREAISLEDFERQERGLPPRPQVKRVRVDPVPPVVANHVAFEKLPHTAISDLDVRRVHPSPKGADGVTHIGYNFHIKFESGETAAGFFWEKDLEQLKGMIRGQGKPHLFEKIVF